MRYLISRSGPLAESYIATGGMLRTNSALEIADIVVVMVPALTFRGGVGAKLRELLPQRHGFVVAVSNDGPPAGGASRLPRRIPNALLSSVRNISQRRKILTPGHGEFRLCVKPCADRA